MTVQSQRRLALFAACAAGLVVIAANVHLVSAALRSQPACVLSDGAGTPAKRAC